MKSSGLVLTSCHMPLLIDQHPLDPTGRHDRWAKCIADAHTGLMLRFAHSGHLICADCALDLGSPQDLATIEKSVVRVQNTAPPHADLPIPRLEPSAKP